MALAFEFQSIDPEWVPVARRSLNIAAGGLMAVWGNYLPKLMSPWQPEEEPFTGSGCAGSLAL